MKAEARKIAILMIDNLIKVGEVEAKSYQRSYVA